MIIIKGSNLCLTSSSLLLAAVLLRHRGAAPLLLPRGLRLDVHRGHPSLPDRCWRHLQQRLPAPQLLRLRLREPGRGGGHLCHVGLQVLWHR